MVEANIKFEFDNYTIIADAEIHSVADIRELKLDWVGLSKAEVKKLDKELVKIVKELAKEYLADSVYSSELNY